VERGKWSGGYLNIFSLSTASPLREATNSLEKAVALLRPWVQMSPIHFFLRGNYGIKSGLFLKLWDKGNFITCLLH
jgi:hypothetical protein